MQSNHPSVSAVFLRHKVEQALQECRYANSVDLRNSAKDQHVAKTLFNLNQLLKTFGQAINQEEAKMLMGFVRAHTAECLETENSSELNPSLLFYTAEPTGEMTKLFCEIVHLIAPLLELSAIEILLPDIALKSVKKDYDHCGLVKINMPTEDLQLHPAQRDNSDPIRALISSYLKSSLAILWHRNQLYLVKKVDGGDHGDHLDIALIEPTTPRRNYNDHYASLKNIFNNIASLPNHQYKTWDSLRLIETYDCDQLIFENNEPCLVKEIIDNTEKYYCYGFQNNTWCLQEISPSKNLVHLRLIKNLFNKN